MTDFPARPQAERNLLRHHTASAGRTKWLSRFLWAGSATACVALIVHLVTRIKYSGVDSWLPMGRALDFLHGHSTGLVYQKLFFSAHVKFQYPPTGLLALDLLRWIGVKTPEEYNAINAGVLIMTGLLFALFVVQVFGSIRWRGVRLPIGPIAFFLAIRFYPNNLGFQLGQMQILLGLLFLMACLALLHDKRLLAGCLIAAAATIKPQFLPFGLLALWQKDWHFVSGFVAVTVLALVLSIALYGWDTHLDYLNVLRFLSEHGEYQHQNQSINGIFNRLLYHGPSLDLDPDGPMPQAAFPPYISTVYVATLVSSLVMLAIPFIIPARGRDPMSRLVGFCAACALFTMASPVAWVHHYNILLPGYVVALKVASDGMPGKLAWITLILTGISYALVSYPLVPPFSPTEAGRHLLELHVYFGAWMLVGILLFLGRSTIGTEVSAQPIQS